MRHAPGKAQGKARSVLAVNGLGIDFGGVTALDQLSFTVPAQCIYSVIGPNGAGKTTLFNLVSGIYQPARGNILLQGETTAGLDPHTLAARGLSRTFQNLQVFFRMTALENVMVGRHMSEHGGVLAHMLGLSSVARQNRATADAARALLDMVGLAGAAGTTAGSMSYGALKRLEIARALATEPALLMLDEPAAGCNGVETDAIARLIQKIAKDGITVMLVEHDMKLVMAISDHVLVLDQGRKLTEGPPGEVRTNPNVIRAYLGEHGAAEAGHVFR